MSIRTFKSTDLSLTPNNPNQRTVVGHYTTGDFLTDDNVIALTKYEISRRLGMQVDSIEHNFHLITLEDLKTENKSEIENVTSDIVNEIKKTKEPALLTVSNGTHFVSVALLPDPVEIGKIHVIYTNSAANSKEQSLEKCRDVGLDLANMLNNKCNNAYPLHKIEINPSQQIVNNCGAQTAFNNATVAEFYLQRNIEGKKKSLNMHELSRAQENQVCNRIAAIPNKEIREEEFKKLVRVKFGAMEQLKEGHIPKQQDLPHNYLKELTIIENKYLTTLQQEHTNKYGQVNLKAVTDKQIQDDYKLALELQKEELQKAGNINIKTDQDVLKETRKVFKAKEESWQNAIRANNSRDTVQHGK